MKRTTSTNFVGVFEMSSSFNPSHMTINYLKDDQKKNLKSYTQPFKNTFTNTLHMTHNQSIGDNPMQIDVAQFEAFTLEKMFNASDN